MSSLVDVGALNRRLKGKSELVSFELIRAGDHFNLKLSLAEKAGEPITLVCTDVQNLELNPTGDGFEQMLRLEISDLREDGLDRIRFSVEELERETLFLHCAEITVA